MTYLQFTAKPEQPSKKAKTEQPREPQMPDRNEVKALVTTLVDLLQVHHMDALKALEMCNYNLNAAAEVLTLPPNEDTNWANAEVCIYMKMFYNICARQIVLVFSLNYMMDNIMIVRTHIVTSHSSTSIMVLVTRMLTLTLTLSPTLTPTLVQRGWEKQQLPIVVDMIY
jgi:hypothetical protein